MVISVWLVLALLGTHFVSDFLLQTDRMAKRKSTSNRWLTIHVVAYSLPFLVFGLVYAVVNGCLHWCVDYVSSRASSRLYRDGEIHWFFVVVGADQFVHASCLLLTAGLIRPLL